MRQDAAQTLHDYDLRPIDSDIYCIDTIDRGKKMINALREWEQRRGITFSFRNRFVEPKPNKIEQNAKEKPVSDRPIVVPREPKKRGRKAKYTKEERLRIKNEKNKQYREQNKEAHRERARKWRASLTPEQRAEVNRKLREWKAAHKKASVCVDAVPLHHADL